MQVGERPPREERTPDTEAAYILTRLQEKFAELATKSPTWQDGCDPSEFFVNDVYLPLRNEPSLDADKERDEFIDCLKQAAQTGGAVDDGLVQILYIATAYCAQAQMAYETGNESMAWSLIADANYWHGILYIDGGNKSYIQASSGGQARWKADPKSKEKDFVFERWKSWQANPSQYKSQAKFARDMLDKCEHLESQKVIEDWCRAWKNGQCAS